MTRAVAGESLSCSDRCHLGFAGWLYCTLRSCRFCVPKKGITSKRAHENGIKGVTQQISWGLLL